jgi:hypothetical protein
MLVCNGMQLPWQAMLHGSEGMHGREGMHASMTPRTCRPTCAVSRTAPLPNPRRKERSNGSMNK